jgi:hypothetical protein
MRTGDQSFKRVGRVDLAACRRVPMRLGAMAVEVVAGSNAEDRQLRSFNLARSTALVSAGRSAWA